MKSWLEKNIEMQSTHNEGKSVAAEKFMRTLKNKTEKYMTSISKMCISINQIILLMSTIMYIMELLK